MPTIRELLTRAIPLLEAAGVDSPRLDAELLLAHVLGQGRPWLWTHPDIRVPSAQQVAFQRLLDRRLQREPLPYLLGEWEFYGRSFHVTPAVLIPRPETELLVEAVLAWARARHATRIADVGAGSGAIAVTLAAEIPALRLLAVDISPAALEIARRNAERHGVGERIRFFEGDLLEPLVHSGETPVDAIVANLPYIAEEQFSDLMPEVRAFEPPLALAGGPGGLEVIRRIIEDSPGVLAPTGLLALEVGEGQAGEVTGFLHQSVWQQVRIIDDYAGIPRHVLAEYHP
ncbi:MAG: peptide chain release factor N(5)-glutamine methyltransferase [Armatimonadota bacterium]